MGFSFFPSEKFDLDIGQCRRVYNLFPAAEINHDFFFLTHSGLLSSPSPENLFPSLDDDWLVFRPSVLNQPCKQNPFIREQFVAPDYFSFARRKLNQFIRDTPMIEVTFTLKCSKELKDQKIFF